MTGEPIVTVTPEVHASGLVLRVTRTSLDAAITQTSEVITVDWVEGRRLLANLVSVLNLHHGRAEAAAVFAGPGSK